MSNTFSTFSPSGPTTVEFRRPAGLAFDSSGNLYVANILKNNIIQIDITGTPSVYAQISFIDLGGPPLDVAVDKNNNVYCTINGDVSNSAVLIIPPTRQPSIFASNQTSTFLDPSAVFHYPGGLVFDATEEYLYCTNINGQTITKISSDGSTVSLVSKNTALSSPEAIAFDNDYRYLYCKCIGGILQIDTANENTENILTITDVSFNYSVYGMVFDSYNNLYCSQFSRGFGFTYPAIIQINMDTLQGNVYAKVGDTFDEAYGLAIKDDILYVSNNRSNIIVRSDEPVCFNHDTKILCLNHLLQEEYIPIQDLKKGDFVKTYLHGYRKIEYMYQSFMGNNPNKWNHCMYKMEKTEENGLLEDLILTGGHSIMVDSISEVEQERYSNIGLSNFAKENKIDEKYLLLASVSEQFIPLTDTNTYTIYHFCLKNNGDDTRRYGVWANGILTETPSKQYLVQHNIWKC